MTSMMEVSKMDMPIDDSFSQLGTGSTGFRIKRKGARPICFHGHELAMAMSFTPQIPYWYELNIYHTIEHKFVVSIRRFHQDDEMQDTVQAWDVTSLEEAIDVLTSYDAGFDVPVCVDFGVAAVPPAELAASGLRLWAEMENSRQHYQSLVGEFLYDLEAQV